MIIPLPNFWVLLSQTCYSWDWVWLWVLSYVDWERCQGRDSLLEWFDWFQVQVIWLFLLLPCNCRESEDLNHMFWGWKGSLLRGVCSLPARRKCRRWLACLVDLLTPRTWAEWGGSYLFEVRSISFKCLLDLSPEQFWRIDSKFFAFLAIDPHKLLRGVIIVLDLLLRSHLLIKIMKYQSKQTPKPFEPINHHFWSFDKKYKN